MSDDCTTCLVYATLDDWNEAGIPAAATVNVDLNKVQKALMRASREADTYLRDRYHLPMKCPIDPALTQWVIAIAVYRIMSLRGYNPNANGADVTIRMNFDDAMKSLGKVANGQQQLCVKQAAPPSCQPEVYSSPTRGFTAPGGEDMPFSGPNTWGN